MRSHFILAIATLALCATNAAAQPQPAALAGTPCEDVRTPPAPTIPNGATVSPADMSAASAAYQNWRGVRLHKLQACRSAAESANPQASARALTEAYDAANAELREVTERWDAEVAAFDARQAPPPAEGAELIRAQAQQANCQFN